MISLAIAWSQRAWKLQSRQPFSKSLAAKKLKASGLRDRWKQTGLPPGCQNAGNLLDLCCAPPNGMDRCRQRRCGDTRHRRLDQGHREFEPINERHTYAGSGCERLSAYDYASALSEWRQMDGRGSSALQPLRPSSGRSRAPSAHPTSAVCSCSHIIADVAA